MARHCTSSVTKEFVDDLPTRNGKTAAIRQTAVRETSASRHHVCLMCVLGHPLKTLGPAKHYRIEGIKAGLPQLSERHQSPGQRV